MGRTMCFGSRLRRRVVDLQVPRRCHDGLAAALVLSLVVGGSGAVAMPRSEAPAGGVAQGPRDPFTLDELLSLRHPASPSWSPDGSRAAFLWHDGASVDVWTVAVDGGDPTPVTKLAAAGGDAAVSGFAWMPEGRRLVYAAAGDLHLHDVDTNDGAPLAATPAIESLPRPSPDGASIAFARGGELWVHRLGTREERRLARWAGTVRDVAWSPDGAWAAVVVESSDGRPVPGREPGDAAPSGLVAQERRTSASSRDAGGGTDLFIVPLAGGAAVPLERGEERSGAPVWSDGGALAWQQISSDARRRRILVAAAPGWNARPVVDESDELGWTLAHVDAGPRWEPGGQRLAFLSDRDGWCHLWVVDAGPVLGGGGVGLRRRDDTAGPAAQGEGAAGAAPPAEPEAVAPPQPLQLTAGEYEVEAPAWRPGGGRVAVAANRGSAGERGLLLVDVPDGAGIDEQRRPLSAPQGDPEAISMLRGTSILPSWSPDGERILFLHADAQRPLDLWVQEPRLREARRLTESWPADRGRLVVPQPVRFLSADGRMVPAHLLLPEPPPEGPAPAIVWLHGGDGEQGRHGWPPARAAALFYGLNQLLVAAGYVVLAVDYRGSGGYGRAQRTAASREPDDGALDDVLAARRYLRGLDEPRLGRIGVWGFSGGGRLVVQALAQAPTAFDAGVDIAGETADSLEPIARPLLVLHGADDAEVPVSHPRRLIEALAGRDRPFEAVIYPGEGHEPRRPATWADVHRRVADFFDRHLRNGR